MSTTPIAVGVVVVLVGLWLLSTAVSTPFVDPSQAEGAAVGRSGEPSTVPFPSDMVGLVDVFASSDDGTQPDGRWFTVVDEDSQSVASFDTRRDDAADAMDPSDLDPDFEPELNREEGRPGDRYELVDAALLDPDTAFSVVVSGDFSGRMAFVSDTDPPTYPNWKAIGWLVAFCAAGAAVAAVWTVRRWRWHRALGEHKRDLEARGYVVD